MRNIDCRRFFDRVPWETSFDLESRSQSVTLELGIFHGASIVLQYLTPAEPFSKGLFPVLENQNASKKEAKMSPKHKTEYDKLEYEMRRHINSRQRHNPTRRQYKGHAVRYINYLKANNITPKMAAKAPVQCIQQYYDHLMSDTSVKPLSSATARTYISCVCGHYGFSMAQIKKKKRGILESKKVQKGMDKEKQEKVNIQGQKDAEDPRYQRLLAFQQRAGLRRAELEALTRRNFKADESGEICIEVLKGKGGKKQLQRILPEDFNFIREYFGVSSNSTEMLFTAEEKANEVDLHTIRASHARSSYKYYKNLFEMKPTARAELQAQLLDRFFADNKSYQLTTDPKKKQKKLEAYIKDMTGEYKIRGDSKIVADAFGREHIYDRLALMAVSVFHLAHWRNDVTVRHYMLAP